MFKRVTRGWLARAGIASAVGAAAIFAAVTLTGSGTAKANPGPIQWTVNGPSVVVLGSSFGTTVDAVDSGAVTWGGYQLEIGFNPAILTVGTVAAGGIAGCSGPNWANPTGPGNSPIIQTGCAFQSSTASGTSETIGFTCSAPGNALIHMATLVEDPIQGSTFFDPNAVNIVTDLTDLAVKCALPITKSDDTGGTAIAGSSYSYTIHVGDPGAVSNPGHTISDTVPATVTVTGVSSTNGALDGCSNAGNVVSCTSLTANAGTGTDVTVTIDVPLGAAGTNGVCNTATLDGVLDSNVDCFDIAPSGLTVTKVVDGPHTAGDPISWTISVTSTGPSPAQNVVVTDTPTDGWSATDPLVYNLGDMAVGANQVIVINGNVDAAAPADQTCNNSVAVTSDNGASANAAAVGDCKPPFPEVAMVKLPPGTGYFDFTTTGGDPLAVTSRTTPLVNLWLCKGVTCDTANGQGGIDINEYVVPATLSGADPDGVGAFEFQVKYDNHIFDISITATNWLYDTGRVPGAAGIGGCSATIITENDIRFGCVSKNPVDGNGNPIITPGNNAPGNAATIHVTPKADLVNRITPGNDNGAIRSLLNEGCELADIWGHPLSTGALDALGREILLPGVLPGGQIADCRDITITVRILEGDMNLDCSVTVADDQIEASHYGAFFGNLLYQPWYDLEPWLKDGDVDIKDLQKVFGRNGSTCDNPVPAQPALPEPVDP